MDVFQDFIAEDYLNCGTTTGAAGIHSRLYYAPASYFEKLVLPAENEPFLITEDNLKFHLFKGWAYWDCLIDESEIRIATSGSVGRLKLSTSLSVFLLNMKPDLVALVDRIINEDLVFLLIDTTGQQWLLGNLRNPARIEKSEGTTGKKYEDNAGFLLSISSKSVLYPIQGDSTKLYVNKNWTWVLATNDGAPIVYTNNKILQLNKK